MKLLLTSGGITNNSIHNALVELLGKPIADSNALFIPTAIYPYPGGANYAYQAILGRPRSPLTQLGWKSLGVLELTALSSIQKEVWTPAVRDADALLFWGGDPVFLAYWIELSGLKALLPLLPDKTVYVGVSAGSMAASTMIGEAYTEQPRSAHKALITENISLGDISRTFVLARGAELVDFAIIPHYGHPDHPDASLANAGQWAEKIPLPVYAIDDQTAIKVYHDQIEVISEGNWKMFNS